MSFVDRFVKENVSENYLNGDYNNQLGEPSGLTPREELLHHNQSLRYLAKQDSGSLGRDVPFEEFLEMEREMRDKRK